MKETKTRRKLVKASEIVKEILRSQPVGKEIEILFERKSNKLTIKGDKTYILLPYKKSVILFADGDIVRDDIKYSKDLGSDIDSMLYWSEFSYNYERCEDLKTGDVAFIIKANNE